MTPPAVPPAPAPPPHSAPNPAPIVPQTEQAAHILGAIRSDLELLETTPLADQPAIYERIHQALTAALDATVVSDS